MRIALQTVMGLRTINPVYPVPRRKKLVLAKYGEWESVIGGKSTLRDFVPDGLLGANGKSFAKCLGRWLKRASTRRWGNIELVAVEDKHEGGWKYRMGVATL